MNTLADLGWTTEHDKMWQTEAQASMVPGRVIADFGTSYTVGIPETRKAELSGKLAHHSSHLETPKVGDWVQVRTYDDGSAVIEALLPRRNELARKAPGTQTKKQVIAANVDVAFVMLALDKDFNLNRLQRFLYQLSLSDIRPVIVLNKADKTDHPENYAAQLTALELPIVQTIALDGTGTEQLLSYLKSGQTAVLLGSSGVGKSTMTNHLFGLTIQRTQAVRQSDDTGKHTTVHRELFVLPGGGLLIDTPGIRELQLWGTESELEDNFDDIKTLIEQCKFTSCQHGVEPGCAVREALDEGRLERQRYEAYLKMKGELVALKKRTVVRAKLDNRLSKTAKKKRTRSELDEFRREGF